MSNSRKYLPALALAAVTAFIAPAPAATLIGDTITMQYFYPTISDEYFGGGFPLTVTGAEGTSDLVKDSFPGGPFFSVDIEAQSIIVTFLQNTWFTGTIFDGIVLSSIDSAIETVSQSSGPAGIVSKIGNMVSFNFVGHIYGTGQRVVADVGFAAPSAPAAPTVEQAATPAEVPLPPALPLFASVIAGLAVLPTKNRLARKRAR
ncbi:hypothetical protein L0V05_02655 [Tabrizicola sp. J26]|uniref:hypothetical protein n=1 Tax=Alitabrizicola rongguiensis TaxID=2909234 RepID=UPI001F3BAE7F|nr:hypothetical protein [Tabrizicola rongguiensis]MCF1707709.1 hypothetical protein [Tabrizicola rongguiensis]